MENFRNGLKIGDWIHHYNRGIIAQIYGFDSNGITLMLHNGNMLYEYDTAGIEDCVKIEHTSEMEQNIFKAFGIMWLALDRLTKVYDWHEDLAGKVSRETLVKISKMIEP